MELALQTPAPSSGEIQDTFRDLSAHQARDAGYADLGTPRELASPDRDHFAVGDGTVVASPIRGTSKKKSKTDESAAGTDVEPKPQRVDSGAGWHGEAGADDEDHLVYGPKFVHLSIRQDQPLSRIVLDMRYQPPGGGYGGEAAIAVTMVKEALPRLPGLTGVCWDGALRGVHRDQLMKHGLLIVSPQHDGIQPRRLAPADACPCLTRHDLWAKNGAVHEAEVLDTGEFHLTPCATIRLERRGQAQRHRWYHVLRLSCGHTHRIRLDATSHDVRTEFNRAEHLRQHPPDTDGYTHCYRWRPDAESLNAQLDATLWNRRMIAYGASQQTLIMLGFVLAQNSLTRYLHQHQPRSDATDQPVPTSVAA